jgi:microcin C transport system substrate-binding protein
MAPSRDEISTEYGLLAEAVMYAPDYSWAKFRLRPEAKWHDGEPVTADDVVWSLEQWKRLTPFQADYYQHVAKAEVTGEREVTFTFDQAGNRELPHIIGQLVVLPRHYWEGKDASGKARNIAATTLEAPLGSGPYRIKTVVAGRTVAYARVPDYWGKDLAVNVGANNFDEIRYEYVRDDTAALVAFTGDQVDWRTEPKAKDWATAYDFPAVKDGRVKLELFENNYRASGIGVGFLFNLNRELFKDRRVREAFNLALPFESMNKTLYYGQYQRIGSYFFGEDLASSGLPAGKELDILNTVKDQVPPEVFTTPFANPVNDTPAATRDNQRKALALLAEAGYRQQGTRLVGKDGKPLSVEFLIDGPLFEPTGLAYQAALARIGIELRIRTVDDSQYTARVRSRDFDIIYGGWAQSASPGNEQIGYFGSSSADADGKQNYSAIRDGAVDTLIEAILNAADRDTLVAATHALDRVLLWQRYMVPGWTLRAARVARWDRFSHPEPLPKYDIGFPDIWWWDKDKAARVGGAQ